MWVGKGFCDRMKGSENDGDEPCREFVKEYRDHMPALRSRPMRPQPNVYTRVKCGRNSRVP